MAVVSSIFVIAGLVGIVLSVRKRRSLKNWKLVMSLSVIATIGGGLLMTTTPEYAQQQKGNSQTSSVKKQKKLKT